MKLLVAIVVLVSSLSKCSSLAQPFFGERAVLNPNEFRRWNDDPVTNRTSPVAVSRR